MIAYLSKGELTEFLDSEAKSVVGFSFEWEQEAVVHLHPERPLHGYGREGRCLFSRETVAKESVEESVSFLVESLSDSEVKCHKRSGAAWLALDVRFIPSRGDLYSRNRGLLEVGVLEKKRVMIIGLGSFGSHIAVELAKAGVGHFSLWDFDRVELHNLARHIATTRDLGRLKTDVMDDAIKGKNPYAAVEKFPLDINDNLELMEREIAKSDLVICATDNNQSRMKLSMALLRHGKVAIFGRAVTRAEGGDVFRYKPGGACYCCLIGNGWFDQGGEEITHAADPRIPAYAADPDALVQVGLSSDIEPICNLMVKLALVELSRGCDSGLKALEDELVFDYYLWANRRERRYRNWVALPTAGNKPTILRWYGAKIPRDEQCAVCAEGGILLDEGDALGPIDVGNTADIAVNLDL